MQTGVNDETKKLAALAVFLRLYGVLSLIIFGALFVGFAIETPLLAEGGALNWLIWNGIQCGREPCHVPPMLFIVYLVWGVAIDCLRFDRPSAQRGRFVSTGSLEIRSSARPELHFGREHTKSIL